MVSPGIVRSGEFWALIGSRFWWDWPTPSFVDAFLDFRLLLNDRTGPSPAGWSPNDVRLVRIEAGLQRTDFVCLGRAGSGLPFKGNDLAKG